MVVIFNDSKSNSVSFIASTECFQHIPEFEKAAEEMHRVLKPGAILVCSNSNPYSDDNPHSTKIVLSNASHCDVQSVLELG